MKIKALIFDLDDTLYNEKQFVKSGFQVVAAYLAKKSGIDKRILYDKFLNTFNNRGREYVFDRVLEALNIYRKEAVLEMLNVYRNHLPNITLFSDARKILPQMRRKYHTALLTDGVKQVQKNKIDALKIADFFDVIVYAVDYDGKNIKAFSEALEGLNAEPSESVYIDDNPFKAFAVAKQLNICTVRILRGESKNLEILDEQCMPRFEISNLYQLPEVIHSIQSAISS